MDCLVKDRLAKCQGASSFGNYQVSSTHSAKDFGCVKMKTHLFRVGSGRHQKVVFQLLAATVIDKINASIDLGVADFGECWNTLVPLSRIVANKIVSRTGKPFLACDQRI